MKWLFASLFIRAVYTHSLAPRTERKLKTPRIDSKEASHAEQSHQKHKHQKRRINQAKWGSEPWVVHANHQNLAGVSAKRLYIYPHILRLCGKRLGVLGILGGKHNLVRLLWLLMLVSVYLGGNICVGFRSLWRMSFFDCAPPKSLEPGAIPRHNRLANPKTKTGPAP